MGYVNLFMFCSYFSLTVPQMSENNYLSCAIWMYIESIIMLILTVYLDQVLGLNGYKPEPWWSPFGILSRLLKKESS